MMADKEKVSEPCPSSSYFKEISIDFGDGLGVTTCRLDLPTYNKVMAHNTKTIRLLQENRNIQSIAVAADKAESLSDMTDRKMPKIWSRAETQLLIDLRVQKEGSFTARRRAHKTLWAEIAKELGEHGYSVSGENCANKWKLLKRSYKDVVDHNSCTGNDPKTCAFFDTFNDLYGNKPSTRPQFTLDSSTSTNCSDNKIEVEDNFPDMRPDYATKRVAGRKCRQKKEKRATLEWLQSWKEDKEKRKRDKDEVMERRHEEKMMRLDRLLDIMDRQQAN
ncbi:hypothetical protein GJAV_G00116050 [Gymnothorax javanicus]|nr:hypothetical protein GJAV_G00116050 [Gymnothorax javanicus]